MRTKKAFTLVELLVVIAVIALLLAILLPSLNKARELANRIVCGQHLKTLTQASNAYSNTFDGFYVPLSFHAIGPNPTNASDNSVSVTGWHYRWMFNRALINYIQKKSFGASDNSVYQGNYALPKEFLCPSDKISKDPSNKGTGGVLLSYAYNGQEWGWAKISNAANDSRSYCGFRSDLLKAPGDKMQFTDSVDWWCTWKGADYRAPGWDELGQVPLQEYKDLSAVHGPVIYRHSEGANVGFYDGHVEHMKKTEIFVKEDFDSPSPSWCGMWTASGYTSLKN
jgi:prepilin-type N-terminal cleavage/methylation domain-containing protein/prepilin-type processing-associated H-X9-DG protein